MPNSTQLPRIISLRCLVAVFALAAGGLLFFPHDAQAYPAAGTRIEVTTTTDELNNDGDCSLREAVRAANTDAAVDACPAGNGTDAIFLPAGTYKLSIDGSGENASLTGDLDVLDDLTISGAGAADTIIQSAIPDRIFHVSSSSRVTINNLTLRNGTISIGGYGGGAVLNDGSASLTIDRCAFTNNNAAGLGGAIDNISILFVYNSTFRQNSAGQGGAIYNDGDLLLRDITFDRNTAETYGGAVANGGVAGLTNVTFSGNTGGVGGGLFNDGEVTVFNSTFTANSVAINSETPLRISNTIVANSTETAGVNCAGLGNISSQGNNIDSGDTCEFTNPTDKVNTDPRLDPVLQDNGGDTFTHALLLNSPATDKGNEEICPNADQRGYLRADGDDEDTEIACDIGAFEFNGREPGKTFLPMVYR
ncbi:MAG: CSLREA domain-containing protein [Anaerolineales bacterium]|nr:CSLREA domain-containing protein [Anaerolineales bacterium]